jgi:hypothetical protein
MATFSRRQLWWHNNFDYPRSIGGINMRPAEAHWLYRWSHSIPLPDQGLTVGDGATVEIVES